MNKQIKNKIYTTLDHLYDELHKCYTLKKQLHFDLDFGELVCNETRIKLLKDFINLFKLLRKKDNNDVLKILSRCTDRCKLHFSQLKRMETKNLTDNKVYFTTLLRVAYNLRLSTCY